MTDEEWMYMNSLKWPLEVGVHYVHTADRHFLFETSMNLAPIFARLLSEAYEAERKKRQGD
jgi:hypothetical protein